MQKLESLVRIGRAVHGTKENEFLVLRQREDRSGCGPVDWGVGLEIQAWIDRFDATVAEQRTLASAIGEPTAVGCNRDVQIAPLIRLVLQDRMRQIIGRRRTQQWSATAGLFVSGAIARQMASPSKGPGIVQRPDDGRADLCK